MPGRSWSRYSNHDDEEPETVPENLNRANWPSCRSWDVLLSIRRVMAETLGE
jgi:hypothetical protein